MGLYSLPTFFFIVSFNLLWNYTYVYFCVVYLRVPYVHFVTSVSLHTRICRYKIFYLVWVPMLDERWKYCDLFLLVRFRFRLSVSFIIFNLTLITWSFIFLFVFSCFDFHPRNFSSYVNFFENWCNLLLFFLSSLFSKFNYFSSYFIPVPPPVVMTRRSLFFLVFPYRDMVD